MLHTDGLDGLTHSMMTAPVYSTEQLEELWEKHRARRMAVIERMLDTGESYGVASGGPSFLNQPYDRFQCYLRDTDNNLDAQVRIVTDAFSHYLITGERPAPYFPMRIAIILRKTKMREKEKEFLSAWCRHFGKIGRSAGVKYEELAQRAIKMGLTASS